MVSSLLCRLPKFTPPLSTSMPTHPTIFGTPSQTPRPLVWSPPQYNEVKINVDVSIKNGESFIGLVARGTKGVVLHLQAAKSSILNVEAVEAFDILFALHLALGKGWHNIIVESDLQLVIHKLLGSLSS